MTVVLHAETGTDSIESVVAGLIRAWNSRDALAFAGYFAEDGDLVNVHGMHLRGRQAIAAVYEMLFRSAFATSTLAAVVSKERSLRKGVALAHVRFDLNVVGGPRAGLQHVLSSLVLMREAAHWQVLSLHNTVVTAPQR